MRTTVSIDDDVLHAAKRYAESRSVSLGAAITRLVRRGLTVERPTKVAKGLVVFDLPAGSAPVTTKHVRDLESEQE